MSSEVWRFDLKFWCRWDAVIIFFQLTNFTCQCLSLLNDTEHWEESVENIDKWTLKFEGLTCMFWCGCDAVIIFFSTTSPANVCHLSSELDNAWTFALWNKTRAALLSRLTYPSDYLHPVWRLIFAHTRVCHSPDNTFTGTITNFDWNHSVRHRQMLLFQALSHTNTVNKAVIQHSQR